MSENGVMSDEELDRGIRFITEAVSEGKKHGDDSAGRSVAV